MKFQKLTVIGLISLLSACGGGGGSSSSEGGNTDSRAQSLSDTVDSFISQAEADVDLSPDSNLTGIWLNAWAIYGSWENNYEGTQNNGTFETFGFDVLQVIDNGTSITVNYCEDPTEDASWIWLYNENDQLVIGDNSLDITDNVRVDGSFNQYEFRNDYEDGEYYAEEGQLKDRFIKLSEDLDANIGILTQNGSGETYDIRCAFFYSNKDIEDGEEYSSAYVYGELESGEVINASTTDEDVSISASNGTVSFSIEGESFKFEFY